MTRRHEDIRSALDTTLSGISRDPFLASRIVSIAKGETPPVKRKLTLSVVVVLLLVLIAGSAAIAAAYRGVSYFMVERYNSTGKLDNDYLLSDLKQSHSNPLVTATVTDAYWDGVQLSVAYRVSPVVYGQVIRNDCDIPAHDHYLPVEAADIQLCSFELDTIAITDEESGEIIRPNRCSSNWFCEEDGSMSVFHSFPLNSMSKSASVSIPLSLMMIATGERFESTLNFQLPVLDDPIAEHEHVWLPASCCSPKICSVCQRYEGDLGHHDFHPSEDGSHFVCVVCTVTMSKPAYPQSIPLKPGDGSNYVINLQNRLHELGFYSGLHSGKYDDETTEAVKAYQESQGLDPDGICDTSTLELLFP